jgi:putative hydrolase of the HAD superfamily
MQGILIDLDDTLLDDRSATKTAFMAFFQAHVLTCTYSSDVDALDAWRRISASHWKCYELGQVSFNDQRRARVREFLQRAMTDDEADLAFEPYRVAYEASWLLFEDCNAFFERTVGIPKVVITNGDRSQQRRKFEATGLCSHIVDIVTPSDCGYWKPHPEIFMAALKVLNLSPDQCIMIGDDPVRDIAPAIRLGMKAIHIERGNPAKGLLSAIE